jgi:3-hydroxybutyryl-CoA dehydratase
VDEFLLNRTYDQLAVGDRQSSRRRTVTEADIVNWCALTGDWFIMHSDAIYAEASMFGQRIAPGLMVLAFSGGLGVPPATTTVLANYGSDRVRYPNPTFIGDTIHVEIEVSEKRDRDDDTGIVGFRWDVLNHDDEPVCVSVLRVLMLKTHALKRASAPV